MPLQVAKTETQQKFQTMRKTEICTKWESGFCKWGNKVSLVVNDFRVKMV